MSSLGIREELLDFIDELIGYVATHNLYLNISGGISIGTLSMTTRSRSGQKLE